MVSEKVSEDETFELCDIFISQFIGVIATFNINQYFTCHILLIFQWRIKTLILEYCACVSFRQYEVKLLKKVCNDVCLNL